MRDEDRLHDQVELALDNRQIFLLFTASAVVLSLVFALGVVVGKRLSPVVAAQPKSDPLAMLDRAGTAPDDELNFPQALAGEGSGQGQVVNKAAPPAVAPDKAAAASAVDKQHGVKAAAPAKPAKGSKGKAPAPAKPAVVPPAPVRPLPRVLPAAPQAPVRRLAAGGKQKAPKAAKGAKLAKGKAQVETGLRYTLQLSSFQDRREAQAFMDKLRKKGHDVAMVPTRIPGRGLWYRVRLGTFTNWKVAVDAKVSFERNEKSIAYVAKL